MLKNLIETAALIDPERAVFERADRAVPIEELVLRARRVAVHLRADGIRHCVYLGVNGPSVPLALFASVFAGIPFVPMNYRLSAEQLDRLRRRVDAPLIVSDDASFGSDARHWTLDDLWRLTDDAVSGEDDLPEVEGDAIATVLFTSGTTSEPKMVPLRHNNLGAYLLNTIELMGADPGEAALITVPPYHVAAIGATLTNTLGGRRVVYLANFDPADWLATVQQQHVTTAMLVPTMLARIAEHLDSAPAAAPTLRHIAYGGARMAPAVLARAVRCFPHVDFANAYGLTETASTIAILSPADHRIALRPDATPEQLARLGSAGRAIPGVEFEIRDEDDTVLPPRETGELWVRGEQVSGEYLGRGSVLDGAGWFRTQDGAWLDEDGYLYIVGRVDDTIIRGAENIAPTEIEDVLAEHPDIAEAAVVGKPDEEWGERIVAVVVPRTELSADSVRDWVRGRLRASRTPDEVVFAESLPYGPTGKLLRRELAARVVAQGTEKD
ncbi:MAG: fatty acid--CoA ligase family protein [Microbacterium sp.]